MLLSLAFSIYLVLFALVSSHFFDLANTSESNKILIIALHFWLLLSLVLTLLAITVLVYIWLIVNHSHRVQSLYSNNQSERSSK